jgi:hypothetical protein
VSLRLPAPGAPEGIAAPGGNVYGT